MTNLGCLIIFGITSAGIVRDDVAIVECVASIVVHAAPEKIISGWSRHRIIQVLQTKSTAYQQIETAIIVHRGIAPAESLLVVSSYL
ncbi:MAG: hypothetical protein PHE51_07445 [Eubacteriales bacterium]|nr:hypothetical protein [Eubacteriales bacterium]